MRRFAHDVADRKVEQGARLRLRWVSSAGPQEGVFGVVLSDAEIASLSLRVARVFVGAGLPVVQTGAPREAGVRLDVDTSGDEQCRGVYVSWAAGSALREAAHEELLELGRAGTACAQLDDVGQAMGLALRSLLVTQGLRVDEEDAEAPGVIRVRGWSRAESD
jgi:hypothetical protein